MREQNLSRLSSNTRINKSHLDYLVYVPLMRDLEFAISKYANGKVIDIGCGNKPYENMFSGKSTGYTGCDIVQSSLHKVDVICEANAIPLPDNSFDTGFSTQTIEHVADHQGLVNEAYRLIRPGAFFILAGPMYWPLHEEPYDFFRFTKHGFEHILKKAGFEVVDIFSNGGMWAVTGLTLNHSITQSRSRNFFVRGWRFLFVKLRLRWLVNSFFSWLDKVDYNPINTINYVVVAKKPIEAN